MKEENFKKQIISKVEIFLREITQKPADVNSKTIFSSLNDLEYFFEIDFAEKEESQLFDLYYQNLFLFDFTIYV